MDINTVIMDNDSGYVSHNPESNLDFSSDQLPKLLKSPTKSFCLNEDTLLENPMSQQHHDSTDSIIDASQSTIKSNLSGFDDESDVSSLSLVIPFGQPPVVDLKTQVSTEKKRVLGNITNTRETSSQVVQKKAHQEDKENICPNGTPKKKYVNRFSSDVSPDMFGDEDDSSYGLMKPVSPPKQSPKEKYINKNDTKLLKNVQRGLSGVCPPPSFTVVQLNVTQMLEKIETHKALFCRNTKAEGVASNSLLFTEDSPNQVGDLWPRILQVRGHGLHHNRSKISEEFERLCTKYAERYVGAETQSSCTVFESNLSPSKRKMVKSRWAVKSPGRRLSHLARRRITFSSANLQSSNSSSILGARARQILVDVKKVGLLNKKKSPRKTPSKSPFKTKRRTPSSSAKKNMAMQFRSGDSENMAPSTSFEQPNFKRALFSSPKQNLNLSLPGIPVDYRATKRALFQSPPKTSPVKKSPLKLYDRKRKRCDSGESTSMPVPRFMSMDPRFTQSTSKLSAIRPPTDTSFARLNASRTEEMSDVHKKKLQYAVYESLKLQHVTPSHPQYKVFASVLARVTRRFLQNVSLAKGEGTTERMFRIARCHSFAVVNGKSVDEIVNDYARSRTRAQRPQGYVSIQDFNKPKSTNKENALQDRSNTMSSSEIRENRLKSLSGSRIDRIRKVISFEDKP